MGNKRVKRRIKRKVLMLLLAFILILGALACGVSFYKYRNFDINELSVKKINYEDKAFKIKVSDYYGDIKCGISRNNGKINWIYMNNSTCKYKITKYGNYNIYFKNKKGIKKIEDINELFYLSLKKKKYYIAVGDSKRISYKFVSVGNKPVFNSSDKSVAYVKDGILYAKKSGKAEITIQDKKISVVATDLIDKMPKQYNYNRPYLYCNAFTQNEAKLLDEILFARVKEAGEGTRGGVVAAARFLTLEFPYRISYFSENGRLGPPYYMVVDGEGRYYHKGLYLSADKFKDISPTYKGPATWGCSIYSKPSKGQRNNGLDCSGFTTWVVLNGGFDIGDLPAYSGSSSADTLNAIGKEVKLTEEVALSNKIKPGDLLGEVSVSEGHSAIVIGMDKDNYYVAESLWISPLGVNVNTYKKSELDNNFETVNLMDSYYKKEGHYTNMW